MQSARAGSPAPSGDPFEALLESAAATRRAEPDTRGRQSARQEPAAPRSRAEARNEALTRKDVSGAPARTETPEAQAVQPDYTVDAATGADEQPEAASQTVSTQNSELSTEEPAPAQNEASAAQGSPLQAESDAEGEGDTDVIAATDGDAQEQLAVAADMDADAPELAPVQTAPTETVAEVVAEADPLPVMTADTPVDETVQQPAQASSEKPVQATPVTPAATSQAATDAAPEIANALAAAADKAAPVQAAASPASTADTETPEALPLLSAPQRATAASPEQPQAQPAQPSNFASALADEGAMPSFGDGANQQTQQRPNAPQPASVKPSLDVKPELFADAAKPAAPAPEAASLKAEPDALPEPLRALAQTLNTPSANAIHFRAATLNERAPVPLTPTALAAEIVSRVRDGMQRFEIRLDPPELGRVDVRLEVDRAGNVKTRLTVDRPETLDLMQRDARGLERALQQAGLKTDSGGLEFSLRSHAEGGAHEGHADRHGRGRNLTPDEGGERVEAVIDGYRSSALARGGVDIRI